MKSKAYSLLKFLIGWPLSILALFFILKLIAPSAATLISHLNEISLPLILYATACFLIYCFLRGYIWKRLIKHAGHEISFKDATFIWASSEIKRYIPGNIWSFLGRAVLFAERGIPKKDTTKYTFIEIQLLILGSAAVASLSLPFISKYYALPQYLSIIAPLFLVVIILLYIFQTKFKLKLFFLPNFKPSETFLLLLLNFIMFLAFGFGYYFTFVAFVPIDLGLIWQLTGFSVLSFLIGYLSILTPSGFGVREGVLIFGLTKIMSESLAGFVALFSRLILIIAEVIFVIISYVWYKK